VACPCAAGISAAVNIAGTRCSWLVRPGRASDPLELVLAGSREGQQQLELVLGEPQAEERAEVVFENGLPVLRQRPAGAPRVRAWERQPAPLPLDPPGQQGQDCLRLQFTINAQGELSLSGRDLRTNAELPPRLLGPVR